MSTDYTLAKIGPVELFACERSGAVEIGISRGDRAEGENYLDTDAIFTAKDLVYIIVELAKVASYVSEEPEQIKAQVILALRQDLYLGSMPEP